jgi:hypothetical protein
MKKIYVKTTLGTFVLNLPIIAEKPVAGAVAIVDFDGGERQLIVYANIIGGKIALINSYTEENVVPLGEDEWIAKYIPRFNAEDIEE